MSVEVESRVKRANLITSYEQLDQVFGDETSNRLLLDILAKKEGRMTDIRPDQQTTSEKVPTDRTTARTPQKLRLGVVFAALAVIMAVGIGFVLVNDSNTAAGPALSPVEIGESYINAIDEWDSDAALALLAPGAVMANGLPESPSDIPAVFDFYRANDWRWTATECQQTNVGEPAVVNCTYTNQNAWARALDLELVPGGAYEFVITNGEIGEVRHNHKDQPEWGIFTLWMMNNHNDDYLVMVPDRCCRPSVTPEAIVLWEKYTNEFVAEQDG